MYNYLSGLSIRIKFALGSVFIISLICTFIYTYYPIRQEELAVRAIDSKIKSIFDIIKVGVGIGMGERDIVAISEALDWAKRDTCIVYVIVLDSLNNEILSFNPKRIRFNARMLARSDTSFEEQRVMHYKDEITYQGISFGKMLLGYSLKGLDDEISSQKRTTVYICIIILIMGTALSAIVSNSVTNNIRKLDTAIKKITSEGIDLNVDIYGDDEVGKLTQAFKEMINNLNHSRSELIQSKQFTENIILSMLNCLVILDKDNLITQVNPAFCELLNYKHKEIWGKPFSAIFKDKVMSLTFLHTLNNGQQIQNMESVFLAKGGESVMVLFSASIIVDKKNKKQGIVCVAQDISEQKQAEKRLETYSHKLEKINNELEQFNYVVSHDLKAPLRAIHTLSEWIQEDLSDHLSVESQKNMNLLRGRIERLQNLVNGLLEYSKIGRTEIHPEEVNVEKLLKDVIDLISPSDKFRIEIKDIMPTFMTYRIRLFQVFQNLIGNSIKHSDKPLGKIDIKVEEEGEYYKFTVADNGPGIQKEFYDKIFLIFQRLHARDELESTGIGLTIVKKIIDEQNGKIWIESELGQGTSFIFLWPKEVGNLNTYMGFNS